MLNAKIIGTKTYSSKRHSHIWLDQILPRCVWSKPYVFKVVLKRHITKKQKDENCHRQWQKLATELSILKCIWPGRAKRADGCRQHDYYNHFLHFRQYNDHPHLQLHQLLSSSFSSSTSILVWVIFFACRSLFCKSSIVKECYSRVLQRYFAAGCNGVQRHFQEHARHPSFGLSSIPSMTLKRRKVLILQVIQQMTDRTHQMGNNPLIPVLLFDLTVQIYKQFKI